MSRQLFEEARKVLTQEAAVKLDPVGQEDKDIDNNGVANNTDSYLHKRRKAISAAIASSKNESSLSDEDIAKLKDILGEQGVEEEVEQIDEISVQKAQAYSDAADQRRSSINYVGANKRIRTAQMSAIARNKIRQAQGLGPTPGQNPVKVAATNNEAVNKEETVSEGSGPKEKQRTPYRDINSPEYRAAADEKKQQMAKDRAAKPGKELADKIAKKGVAEETVSEGRPYSASHRIGRDGYTRGSFGLGSSNLDLGGRREAPAAPKPTAPAPKPTGSKKTNEEAGQEELHPKAHEVLKHIKPEFHHIYKPYLTKDIFRNNYRDRADLYTAAERAGHTIEEEVEQIDEISQALKNRVQDARRSQAVDTDLGWGPEVPGHRPVSTATRNRLLQMVGGKGNEPYAKYVLGSHLGKRSRGDLQAAESYELEEVEQIDEVGDTPAGRQMLAKYINKAARRVGVHSAIATGYSSTADDNTASPAQRMAATTLAAQQKHKRDMRLRGVERATNRLTQEEIEQEDFELIENLNFALPENPSYQDFIKAALTIAECNSFSELSEEDQQYIISEMEDAFRNNDLSFIAEAEALSDMNDTVQRLRKAGHRIEDMGKDYKGQPYYVYVDKGTGLRRKVTYKGNQKVTQNMGKAAPEDTNEA